MGNCSNGLVCDESIFDAAGVNAEAIFNAGVQRDYNFELADDLDFSGTALDHPFLSLLNVDDTGLTFNSIADDIFLEEVSLEESGYAVAVVDTSVGSAEGSYTETLTVTPISPAVLLLGFGVLGLVVITRRKRNDVANTFVPN